MDVQETRLQQVLEGAKQYRVPLYQRPYSWTHKQLERLWSDVLELADERRDSNHSMHFTGSLVLSLGQVGPGGAEFLVVDGQQRLTTLSVLICALRDHYREVEPDHPEKVARLHESFIADRFKSGDARLKLLPTQADRPAFRAIVDGSLDDASASGLIDAYRFFRARLRLADDPDDPHDIERIESAVLNGLAFVAITARGEDNVYRIFESLNNTGMKLTQGDLLRNYLFMRLGQHGEEIYDSWWLPMQRALSPADLETLFWIDLVWSNPEAKQGDIYSLQVDRMRLLNEDQIISEVKRYSRLAQLFARIREPQSEPDEATRRSLERSNEWGLAATEPLKLHLLNLRDQGRISSAEVAEAFHLVESFLVRRVLIGASTNGVSRILYRAPLEVGATDVVVALHRYLSTGRKFFATDAQIAEAVTSKPFYYQGRPNQRKTLLSWIERSYASKEPVDLGKTSIEHVMPQTLSPHWQDSLAADLGEWTSVDELHEGLLHTIANLTLTGYNSELSNRPFADKRALLNDSGLRMNSEIATHDSWRRTDILERGALLASRINGLWAAPLTDTDVSDSGVSWKVVRDIVDAIPAGRWASYGDVAAVAGTHPVPLGQFLASAPLTHAYRVLKRFGSVSPGFTWSSDSVHAGIDPMDLLRDEGIEFDEVGRASQLQRLTVSELGELIGLTIRSDVETIEEEEGERSAFLADLGTRFAPSTVHGVAELIEAWERIGGHLEFGTAQEVSCFLMYARSDARPKAIWPLVIYPYGSVEVVFQHMSTRVPFDEPELVEELRERLNRARGIELSADRISKRPPFDLDVLADRVDRQHVIDALEWFANELVRYDEENTAAVA